MSTTTASTALGGGGGAGTPPTASTTGGSGGHAPAHMQQQYNSFTSIRNALKVQYNRLCSTIEAEGRDADDDETAKLEELTEQILALEMQTQSLAFQINNNNTTTTNNNNNQATEARAPAYRLEQPKLSASDPHGDWQIYAVQVRTHIKMLGFNVDNTLTTAQEASLFGTLLNGVKDANLSYLVLNDNVEHRGSVAWLSLQHHFDSSSRAALTTQLNKFLASFYQPEQHPDFDRWLGGLMTQYERIMSIKDIKVSDVLLATCVNHLPNNAAWATFKNGLLAHDVMTKTQFYTAVAAFQENERCRTTVNLQAPAAMEPAAQAVAMLGTSSGHNGGPAHSTVRTEQPTSTTCARCAGRHPTDECRRTRGYVCTKCGGEHYESCCTSAGGSEQPFRQRRFTGPRGRGHHDPRMPTMHFTQPHPMQHGLPMHHMYAQHHPFPGHHGLSAHHVAGGGELQQQPSQQPQRPDGAGPGWGRTTF
jgi:hypothetical protein